MKPSPFDTEQFAALARRATDLHNRMSREDRDLDDSSETDWESLVSHFLMKMTREAGEPAELWLVRAFGLYKIALDARKEGNRVAIVDENDEVVREISGIDPGDDSLDCVETQSPVASLAE